MDREDIIKLAMEQQAKFRTQRERYIVDVPADSEAFGKRFAQLRKELRSNYEKVQEFYDAMGFSRPARPTRIAAERRNQLMAYILSETLEFGAARHLTAQLDAAVDLLYFVMDVFVEMGIDPAQPFNIVHEANMGKVWPDGQSHFDHSVVPPRLLKPEGWKAPEEKLHQWIEQQLK